MNVTEVRIKPATTINPNDRLLGFANIVFDNAFAVSDIKIISGPSGIFVAMPSRKIMDHCPACRTKNAIGSNFCNQCGGKLPPVNFPPEERPKLYADIAHPINAEARAMIEADIIKAYHAQAGSAPADGTTATAAEPTPARTGRRFPAS